MVVGKGNTIVVDYEGRLEDGTVFDSSTHGDHSHPLEFEVGAGNVIKGFDAGVEGMEVGDKKTIEIEAEEAYGPVREELHKEIPRDALQLDKDPEVGMGMMIGTPDGKQFPTKIVAVSGTSITIDMNHPLAGKKLIFDVELKEIK